MSVRKMLIGIGVALFGGALIALYQAPVWKAGLKQALLDVLVVQVLAPAAPREEVLSARGRAIYVMGGAGNSLRGRFAKAAELYRQGLARRVLVKSDSMLMEYSPSLGRNLRHDEWVRRMLTGLGVKEEDIEAVAVKDALLGTYQEAKALSDVVSRRGYGTLVLVSSDYHTARVWYIFSKLMRQKNVTLYVYPAKENPGGYTLLQEFVKFVCYRAFL
jgi:uncharacterized SAM-binding protein YcdF (DUF218 family)